MNEPSTEDFHRYFTRELGDLPDDEELLWVSDNVPVAALRAAYPLGVFPWPGDRDDWIPWMCPRERGVLPLDRFHLGRSSLRNIQRAGFHITFDQAFPAVIRACADFPGRETWIHPAMVRAYTAAHREGFAHSVEVWQGGELAGGLYGIDLRGIFSGESMFHRVPNAGKAGIAALVDRLRADGRTFLDIQQLTPHMEALGAEEWPRRRYLDALALARRP